MLIKKRILETIEKPHRVSVVEISEETRSEARLEIQKAREEASVIKKEAEAVLTESKRKLEVAEAKTKEIIQNANLEANSIKEKVYKETLQSAKGEIEHLRNEGQNLLKELFRVKREALTQAHKEIMNLALDLAEKVIRYQASIDTELLKTQVIEAIKKATSESDRVQVYVNPQDLQILEANVPKLQKLFPSGVEIIPLAKESVNPGSCIVETKSGQLDANFSTQINTLRNLTAHLEVKEPTLLNNTQESIVTYEEDELVFEEENLLTEKEEPLSNEPLIQLPEEEDNYSFEQEEREAQSTALIKEEEEIIEETESEIMEVPEAISEKIQEEIKQIDLQTSKPQKRKLDLDTLLERTKEEQEELDEDFDFEEDEELLEEDENEIDLKDILKPKKKSHTTEVEDLADEVEQNPEWQELLQEEDEDEI